jgi:hypothetical protein
MSTKLKQNLLAKRRDFNKKSFIWYSSFQRFKTFSNFYQGGQNHVNVGREVNWYPANILVGGQRRLGNDRRRRRDMVDFLRRLDPASPGKGLVGFLQ